MDELYSREGVAGVASGLTPWDGQYGVAVCEQLEKQLIVEAACGRAESVYINPGFGWRWFSAGDRSRTSPDFAKAREDPR